MIGYLSFIIMGITLGLLGGGGSILTVPILVYLFEIPASNAALLSLFIVGSSALAAAINDYKKISIKEVVLFSVPSTLSVIGTRKILLPLIPNYLSFGSFSLSKDSALMLVFSILMITISIKAFKKTHQENKVPSKKNLYVFLTGLGVGVVAGLLGAGGGFLIVPALTFGLGMPLALSISHSQAIIAFQSLLGGAFSITGEIVSHIQLLFASITFSILGIFMGRILAKKTNATALKNIFAIFTLFMGLSIFLYELYKTL